MIRPEANRFLKVDLTSDLDEPMQLDILKDGRVLIAERKGRIKLFDPETRIMAVIAEIPVRHSLIKESGQREETEDGVQGVLLDPDFEQNHFLYAYYAPLEGAPRNILARFEWPGTGPLDTGTKKILLEIPVDPGVCCHVGGGMVFDNHGNLLLATGENGQAADGFSTMDERPGHINNDSQKSSANTNDLRGKILRIHPEVNGSYTIPENNLFPKGMPKTRPEIYTMGNRNPWRLSVDSKTNWLYWGEVGPGAGVDSTGRGPRAYDEFNRVKQAENCGYPYFIGNNQAYWEYDYATGKSGERFNPLHPVNNSPNNTGLTDLPPAQPAFIWYPYAISDTFPEFGSGGSSAVGGPVYHRSDFKNPKRPFPDYYENKWFVTDWVRGWIMAIEFDGQGNYKSMERFLPDLTCRGPIDMAFGPDGDLYLLEYGNALFKANPEARLIRIEYNKGNRQPVAVASARKTGGAVPLEVQLSSEGSKDYDKDPLSYQWTVLLQGKIFQTLREAAPEITLKEPGLYTVVLNVEDPEGGKSADTLQIAAGNEPPVVSVHFSPGNNTTFHFPGEKINYTVEVNDKEDGSLAAQNIKRSDVKVSIDYIPEGIDVDEVLKTKRKSTDNLPFNYGWELIRKSDCGSCHAVANNGIGPAFENISKKYQANKKARTYLADKIIYGGSGVWGERAMPAHNAFPEHQVNAIVTYILGLSDGSMAQTFSTGGQYLTKIPEYQTGRGKFVFRASYTDKGTSMVPPLSSEGVIILQNPLVSVAEADKIEQADFNILLHEKSEVVFRENNAYMRFKEIDLTGIQSIGLEGSVTGSFNGVLPGILEIKIDGVHGQTIATTEEMKVAQDSYTGENIIYLSTGHFNISGKHDIYIIFREKQHQEKSKIKIREVLFKKNSGG